MENRQAGYAQEYGLSHADRVLEVQRKFGMHAGQGILNSLAQVQGANEQLLGAIVFLAREQHPEDIPALIQLASDDPTRLLNAAQVKDERR